MSYQLTNLKEYSTFNSVKEMDNAVKQYYKTLSKSHFETLNLLKQYSCKVIGVSHIKIKVIAEKLGKSVATIKRHIKFLKENGFITIVNTTRIKSGGKGANAYVINPIDVQQKIQKEFLKTQETSGNKSKDVEAAEENSWIVKVKTPDN